MNLAALDQYLGLRLIDAPLTMFEGIHKLPPGHLLTFDTGSGSKLERAPVIRRYWRLQQEPKLVGSEQSLLDELQARLQETLRLHLVSDVPVGAFLSGGMDSSLLVAMLSRDLKVEQLPTFTMGLDYRRFDETPAARTVARLFKTNHHEERVHPELATHLPDLVCALDEPSDPLSLCTWLLAKFTRRHVKVVIGGDGGDELFGGYDRYLPHPRVAQFDSLPLPGKRQVASMVWPLLPHGARGKNFLRHVARSDDGRYLDSIAFFQPDEKQSLYSPDMRRLLQGGQAEDRLAAHFSRFARLSPHSRMMRVDFETYLPEDVLTKVDRMSMAHSIETRVPLLDNEVIDFAATLPSSLKIVNGRRKHVLKEAARRLLPPEILDRKKQGFGVPLGVWFQGGLTDVFSDVLRSPTTRQRGYFAPAFVDRMVDEHLTGKRDHTLRLWQLLVFELWHRQYMDAAVTVAA
jgi:asparagine synthase (glutamine-hydrolysing)